MDSPTRKWKRYKVDVRVKLRRVEEPDGEATVVRTFEMSEGGMSVYASESLLAGTMMVVEWSLPGNASPLRVHAVVKNRRGFRCGLQFTDMTEADRAVLVRYLGSLVDVVEI